MDRSRLWEDIKTLKEKNTKHLTKEEKEEILKESIRLMGDGTGKLNLLIVVEELAELQQEVIKCLRDGEVSFGLYEEFVDSLLGEAYIREILLKDADEETLKYIEDIKYLRQQSRNEKASRRLEEEKKKQDKDI